MGKMHNDVIKDENNGHYRMVHAQWWVPLKKGAHNNAKLNQDYWQGKWKCNLTDPIQQADIDTIAFSLPTRKNTTMNNIITISDMHCSLVKSNIDVANEINHI